jgi:nitrate/nitrite transport system ATP-binding protein
MMTNGPAATVGEILAIDLERPRNRLELADDAHYNHLRHEVLRFLYEKQRKVEDFPVPAAAAKTEVHEHQKKVVDIKTAERSSKEVA